MNPGFIIERVMTILQAIVLIASVVTLAITASKAASKPNQTQNARLDALEKWKESVDTRLQKGDDHFSAIDHGNRITQESILALMSHAINGNDTEKLKRAKEKLENYLIEK